MVEKIDLYDGDKKVSYDLLATFQIDDKNYCLLSDSEEEFFLSFEEEGDQILFKSLESEKEEKEIREFYQELLEENSENNKKILSESEAEF